MKVCELHLKCNQMLLIVTINTSLKIRGINLQFEQIITMEFETKIREIEVDSLNRLEIHVNLKKEEIKRRYKTKKEHLERDEKELIEQIDQIYSKAFAALNERNRLITKLDSFREKMEDCKNNRLVATYKQSIAPLNEKIYQLKDDCLIAPNVRLEWNEEAFESTEKLCLCRRTSAPYNERIYPEWTAVEKGEKENEMLEPYSLTLVNGEILVSDRKKNAIQIYSKEGTYLSSIQHPELIRPLYMRSYQNALFVTCGEENGKVLKFERTEEGQWIYIDMYSLEQPINALDIDEKGTLYIFQSKNLQVFALEATSLRKISEFDLKTEHFVEGRTHIMDARLYNGEWYVLFINSEYPLQCFDKNGQLLRTIITSDQLKGALHFCIDPDGNIISTEDRTDQVKAFTNDGEFISNIGSHGYFANPRGVDLDENGRIFICDLKTFDVISCY